MSDAPVCPACTSADTKPARALLVELRTRVASQPLHFRSGGEEAAATSVSKLFDVVRKLLVEHPDANTFEWVAVGLLNGTLRPYTARWHGWMVGERFRDANVRRRFRAELGRLQGEVEPHLAFLDALAKFKEGVQPDAGAVAAAHTAQRGTAHLGASLAAGIGSQVHFAPGAQPAVINQVEGEILLARRQRLNRQLHEPGAGLLNATGLAFSGGGIRSATFALGVTQVLVGKGFLRDFDYLSTVSGGGFFGTFLSSALQPQAGKGDESTAPAERVREVFGSLGQRDSPFLRHLRNSSKYLLNAGPATRLKLAGIFGGGMLLNLLLFLPLPLLAALAALGLDHLGFWGERMHQPPKPADSPHLAGTLLVASGILFVGFAFFLPLVQRLLHRRAPDSGWGLVRRGWSVVTLALGVALVVFAAVQELPTLFRWFASPAAWEISVRGRLLLVVGLAVELRSVIKLPVIKDYM